MWHLRVSERLHILLGGFQKQRRACLMLSTPSDCVDCELYDSSDIDCTSSLLQPIFMSLVRQRPRVAVVYHSSKGGSQVHNLLTCSQVKSLIYLDLNTGSWCFSCMPRDNQSPALLDLGRTSTLHAHWPTEADEIYSFGFEIWYRTTRHK